MSTLQHHSRTRPRLSAFLALFYIFIIFRSSETLCYIAFVAFFFLIWLHDDGESRLAKQREENRRVLVRESLEFRRIVVGQDEEQEQEQEQIAEFKARGNSEIDSLIPPDLEGVSRSSFVLTVEPAQIESHECCTICLEPYAVGDSVARLKNTVSSGSCSRRQCHHWFHEVCILKWLQHHNQCPLCRVDMICDDHHNKIETRHTRYGTYSQPSNVTIV